jgi:hypothetical protein
VSHIVTSDEGALHSSALLLLQLKCTHLIPAKAPLPEEAIFNQNKAAVER